MREPGCSVLCRAASDAAGSRCRAPAVPRARQCRAATTVSTWRLFPSLTTQGLPNSSLKIQEGECQPLAWTVMFPLWLPVRWMSRSLPIRRLRYAPAILFFIVALTGAAWQSFFCLRKQDLLNSFQLTVCARNACGECMAILIRIS